MAFFDRVSNGIRALDGHGSIAVQPSVMACCGLAQIYNIGNLGRFDYPTKSMIPASFEKKAEFLHHLYMLTISNRTVQYVIADRAETADIHELLLEIGSTKVHSYPNLCHGPSILGVWMFDIKNAVGKYLDKAGNPLKEAP